MKRGIRKIVAAGLSALLFLWYFSPGMRTLRALPEGVAAGEKAAAGRFIGTEARPVRSSGDARLGGGERTYTLFGVVPLRTVQEVAALPAVSLGGRAVGIVLYTKGVQVVGFTTVDTTKGPLSPAYAAGLKKGDAILAVDGQAVRGAMSLMDLLQDKEQVTLTVRREEAILTLSLRPAREGDAVGRIDANGAYGVAGLYFGTPDLWGRELPLGAASQVKTGEATLYSAADGTLRGYSCRIIRLKVQSAPGIQGMMVEVTDQALLSLTGGIVPGMSGSPVVQNGRLVGVVTHVFVNEPRRGYCVYAQWMLEKLF